MRWKIRCPSRIYRAQFNENKPGELLGCCPVLSAETFVKPLLSKGFAVFGGLGV